MNDPKSNPDEHTRDGAHDDAHTGSPDDARLTAYVLGELDAKEAAEIEALIASSPDAAREVEEIRALTGLLQQGLAAEAAPELTDAQRAAVLAGGPAATGAGASAARSPDAGRTGARPGGLAGARPWVRNLAPLAAAATVLLAAVWMLMQDRGDGSVNDFPESSPVARLDKEMTGAARPSGDPSGVNPFAWGAGRKEADDDEAGRVARRAGEATAEDRMRRFDSLGYLDIDADDDGRASVATSQTMPSDAGDAAIPRLQELGDTGGDNGIDSSKKPDLGVELVERLETLGYVQGDNAGLTQPADVVARMGEAARGQSASGGGSAGAPAAPPATESTTPGVLTGRGAGTSGAFKAQGGKVGGGHGGQYRGSADAGSSSRSHAVMGGGAAKTASVAEPLRALGYMGGNYDRDAPGPRHYQDQGREGYAGLTDNPFKLPQGEDALSTFSIDVDTGSYSNVRRFLNEGRLPPADAVRIEELINYFEYADAPPESEEVPFAVHVETAAAPWAREHRLVRIGLKGWAPPPAERPAANLVFLLDVSGSMNSPDKLPLLKSSMRLMVNALDERDRVAIVTYAGSSGLVLDSTTCEKKSEILAALDRLAAGGSTNGGAGIELAYKVASEHFIEGGLNRVLLATDGDFNVGVTQKDQLEALITGKAKDGVFLSVLGFGTGNLKDSTVEMLADKGNGHYAYIDSLDEGRRVLVDQLGATLQVIAKDVKIQVEFNPGHVGAWRLIGYENRALAARDFNDDTKDAGEIGAGHGVVALYEIAPPGTQVIPGVDPLKYQKVADVPAPELVDSPELMTIKLRWKRPDSDTSSKIELPVVDAETALDAPSSELRFAAALAAFGMQLRDSPYRGETSWDLIASLAAAGRGADPKGYRAEFARLVDTARAIAGQ